MNKAQIAGKGAITMARHPTLRRATVRAAKPPAKLGWRVGKVIIIRKARSRAEQVNTAGRTAASLVLIYGPMVADVFGLVEEPKPRRSRWVPAFALGVATGAGAVYVLGRRRHS